MAHAFSWPPARLRHKRGGAGKRRSLFSSSSENLTVLSMSVRRRRHRSSAVGTQSLQNAADAVGGGGVGVVVVLGWR